MSPNAYSPDSSEYSADLEHAYKSLHRKIGRRGRAGILADGMTTVHAWVDDNEAVRIDMSRRGATHGFHVLEIVDDAESDFWVSELELVVAPESASARYEDPDGEARSQPLAHSFMKDLPRSVGTVSVVDS